MSTTAAERPRPVSDGTLDPDGAIGNAVDAGKTLPSSWYTSDAIFELEKRAIFRRSWEYVGSRDQVAKPGDFFTCEVGGLPLVVVCGKDEVVRAFHNICRHRHHSVAIGAGNRRLLQCNYHAWTYKLDGSFNFGAPVQGGSELRWFGAVPDQRSGRLSRQHGIRQPFGGRSCATRSARPDSGAGDAAGPTAGYGDLSGTQVRRVHGQLEDRVGQQL